MKLKIGSILVSSMIRNCLDTEGNPVFIQHTEQVQTSATSIKIIKTIRLSDHIYKVIEKGEEDDEGVRAVFSTPRYLQMIIHPLPWTPTQCGGYLTQETNLLRFRSPSQLSVLSRANLSSIILVVFPGRSINLYLMS